MKHGPLVKTKRDNNAATHTETDQCPNASSYNLPGIATHKYKVGAMSKEKATPKPTRKECSKKKEKYNQELQGRTKEREDGQKYRICSMKLT